MTEVARITTESNDIFRIFSEEREMYYYNLNLEDYRMKNEIIPISYFVVLKISEK